MSVLKESIGQRVLCCGHRIGLMVAYLVLFFPALTLAAGPAGGGIGQTLPLWSIIPFAGLLLSIAIFPLVNHHWWEHNMGKISFFWAALFFLPFLAAYGTGTALYELAHIYLIDYIPFIILLGGLFIIAGGIVVRGTLRGTAFTNTSILAAGSLLASCIGTTGASMLLIRPIIRANTNRQYKVHTIIFFIFLVSNIGGSLTPIGDPPLFLGFLHGVPFFWTLHLLPLFLFNVALLLIVYYLLDGYLLRREAQGNGVLSQPADGCDTSCLKKPARGVIRLAGAVNFIFLTGVVVAVIASGALSKHSLFYDSVLQHDRGITVISDHGHTLVLPYINILRDIIIIIMAWLSWKSTGKELRQENCFTWGPIKEVALLFAGIFVTIIPALALLQVRGDELGVTSPAQFFWATGLLSSFLDNAPTYLTFLGLAGSLPLGPGAAGVWTDMGTVQPPVLLAISAGAVYMGANTYIGNAPNFMVRSIAEENKITMPGFFQYMAWSAGILLPLFAINTWVFFR